MENSENESFEDLYNESLTKKISLGEIVTGKIIEITSQGEIFVDLGYKADGIIPKSEYSFNVEDNPFDDFKVGDEITAEVLKMNDGIGNVLLSYKKTKIAQNEAEFSKKVSNGEIFSGEIKQINKSGIVTNVDGVRVFIPLSLSGIKSTDSLDNFIGQTIKFKIIEYEPENKKIIGSNRIIEDEKKQKASSSFWNSVEIGAEYSGTVVRVNPYGAFVDLGGVQGLLHVSEITWKRNANAQDFLKENQSITVTIKDIDKETQKIQLSYPLKEANPWDTVSEKYNLNDVVKVTIKKFMSFGAFAELEDGIEGLVHISQISDERIAKPEDKLQIGQKIDAKIIGIDLDKKKIDLSIKEVQTSDWKNELTLSEGVTFESEN